MESRSSYFYYICFTILFTSFQTLMAGGPPISTGGKLAARALSSELTIQQEPSVSEGGEWRVASTVSAMNSGNRNLTNVRFTLVPASNSQGIFKIDGRADYRTISDNEIEIDYISAGSLPSDRINLLARADVPPGGVHGGSHRNSDK